MKITCDRISDKVAVAQIEGDIDGEKAHEAAELLGRWFEEIPGCDVVLEMAQVPYIDSTGVGVLLELWRSAAARGTKVSLCHIQPGVRKVLEVTKVAKFFTILDDAG